MPDPEDDSPVDNAPITLAAPAVARRASGGAIPQAGPGARGAAARPAPAPARDDGTTGAAAPGRPGGRRTP
ncbi:hypothetical protein GCM10027168_48420 [Streptomyces capparidis]